MVSDKSIVGGSDSVNTIGNGNVISVVKNIENNTFQKSILYDICQAIKSADIPLYDNPAYRFIESAWDEKMDYNRIDVYATIFKQEAFAYRELEVVMKEFTNRAEMILKINHTYRMVLKELDGTTKDNDIVLDNVLCKLMKIVDDSSLPEKRQLYLEQKERYIKLIMFYAFTKCKLLEPVGE